MAVYKKADLTDGDLPAGVHPDTEIADPAGSTEPVIPEELNYLDPDVDTSYTLKISEQFTAFGRNHIVVFEGTAVLRDGEHFAVMTQRLADMVLYGVTVSKDMFIAERRIERGEQA